MDLYERDLGPLKVRRFSTSATPAEIAASINAWLDEGADQGEDHAGALGRMAVGRRVTRRARM